jgi:hypothetical protein
LKLIKTHLGDDLQEASFNTRTLTITIRSKTRWNDGQPEHVEYTAQEIEALVGEFARLEIELFKLRHRIEARHAA